MRFKRPTLVNEIETSKLTDQKDKIIENLWKLLKYSGVSLTNTNANVMNDDLYKTPPFQTPVMFKEKTKLVWYRNFKVWKQALKFCLEINSLQPFINKHDGLLISDQYHLLLQGGTITVLQASVSDSILAHIQGVKQPYDAYSYLQETYLANFARDLIIIFCRFNHLQYKIGFRPERFVADFDSTVLDFLIADMLLSDEF